MANEIMVRENTIPSTHEMEVFKLMAHQAAESKMYRNIGDQCGCLMIMLAARELGIGPMQALNGGLNIINGKVEISARLMNAMIRRNGHRLIVKESTDKSCSIEGIRADTGDSLTTSYTLEEAKIAGLVKPGGGWVKNPKDMCFARALSRLARQLFADVIGIGYIEGEISGNSTTAIEVPVEVETVKETTKVISLCQVVIPPEEEDLWKEYCSNVKNHFEWSEERMISEFNKNIVETYAKFQTWKHKKAGKNG